ncbi:hypothetical protein HPT29_027645 (plasmid) [Microvirga terrae]|uniref:Uncharacterized protein n=1 Tax=Microvirga terrae TaxID=2740529 RepID=A0ABY5RZZ3_9HYPH|nr:hypothetical protein [Microvirga terrae]UVF22795.1 hypothetical protein HPT29_027645 [Microvirga terrae]
MTQTPASIIQETLASTFTTSTPESWVRFGDRVIDALADAGFEISNGTHQCILRSKTLFTDGSQLADAGTLNCEANEEPDPFDELLDLASILPAENHWRPGNSGDIPMDGSMFFVRFRYRGLNMIGIAVVVDSLRRYANVIGTVGDSFAHRLHFMDILQWAPVFTVKGA